MPNRRRLLAALGAGLLLALLAGCATLQWGIPSYSITRVFEAFSNSGTTAGLFVDDLRLPRLLAALLVGALLGGAGTVLQDVLRNPLAGPELLGVSAGGSAVVAACVVFGLAVPPEAIPFLVLGVGALVGFLVVSMARLVSSPAHVALVGAAATSFCYALVLGIISLTPNGSGVQIAVVYRFMAGDLGSATWQSVDLLAPWALILVPLLLRGGRVINVLQLGDDLAEALGLHVRRARSLLFATAVALTAPVVAVAGPISFVALLAPHCARRLLHSSDSRIVLPVAIVLGAVVVEVADLAARLVVSPIELPVGLWTAVVGGPALLVLLRDRIA